jgi:hypothetical protein
VHRCHRYLIGQTSRSSVYDVIDDRSSVDVDLLPQRQMMTMIPMLTCNFVYCLLDDVVVEHDDVRSDWRLFN